MQTATFRIVPGTNNREQCPDVALLELFTDEAAGWWTMLFWAELPYKLYLFPPLSYQRAARNKHISVTSLVAIDLCESHSPEWHLFRNLLILYGNNELSGHETFIAIPAS